MLKKWAIRSLAKNIDNECIESGLYNTFATGKLNLTRTHSSLIQTIAEDLAMTVDYAQLSFQLN
jgi:hypothetical protein